MNISCLFKGHSWSAWVIQGNLHSADGEWETRNCTRCGKEEERS